MPTLADLLRTPGTPANTVKTTLADLFRGYNREAVAGLLGGSVDIANQAVNLGIAGAGYAGHKLGLLAQPPELIQKPVLGSDWIYERLPNQPALTGSGAENTGRMIGALLSPPVVMQAAPATVRALGRALQEKVPGMAENYLRTIGGLKDIDVWHGSPHKFDRFDSSKIGTGEGAQAYGHGLYLAENPQVAQEYQKLSPTVDPAPLRTFLGRELDPGTPQYHAATLLDGMGLQQARKTVAGWISNADPRMAREAEGWKQTLDLLNQAQSKADFKRLKNPGNLYRVDLPDSMLPRMLDWDAPLSGQSLPVQQAAQRVWSDNFSHMVRRGSVPSLADATGGDFYTGMGRGKDSHSAALMADDLRRAGIPGIRYLDGGSRGAGTGTRNYVVFPGEEGNLRILERNGVPIR